MTTWLTAWDQSVAPKSDTSDPRIRLEGRVRVTREKLSVSEWVAVEDAKGRRCQCGCGKLIRARPHHHRKGVPRYLQGHHPMATTREVDRLRERGLLTSGTVARMLAIPLNTLRGLEGRLFDPVRREGKRHTRVFTSEQVDALRYALREATGLGPQPALVYLDQVARRAGCHVQTIRRRRGGELPAGRWVTHPHAGWGFSPEEAEQIVAWVKRSRQGRRDPRPAG